MSVFRKTGKLYRRTEEIHVLRLYRPAEIASGLRAVGFKVQYLRTFGEMKFPAGLVGFVARK